MDDGFQKFSFSGDFKIPMEESSFSSSVLDEAGAANSGLDSEQRKRKIDKDGFVTPATPDIPKASIHFGESHLQESSDYTDFVGGLSSEKENPEEMSPSDTAIPQPTQFLEVAEVAGGGASMSDTNTLAGSGQTQPPSSVKDIMKGCGMELKFLQEQWIQTFKECEDFELQFPKRLEDFLTESKKLESNLNRQKDMLLHRLQGIGKTLQQE